MHACGFVPFDPDAPLIAVLIRNPLAFERKTDAVEGDENEDEDEEEEEVLEKNELDC